MSVEAEVLEELRDGSGTARQIAEATGQRVESVRRVLKRLETEGVVWGDNYQQPARVYGLKEED
jgi:predicted ArsR family transcriptional regulator